MSPHLSEIQLAVSAVTLTASSLSVLGSGFIIICYAILPLEYHFRCVLILNLAVADFISSLAATVGGINILAHRKPLGAGIGCTLQAFIVQISVQATDCAILAIAVATVFVVTRSSKRPGADGGSQYRQVLLSTFAIWAFPFLTGFLGLGLGLYAPASGNWCWVVAKPSYFRYVLMHGWKFLFIVIDICIYIYLYIWIRRHYEGLTLLSRPPPAPSAEASNSWNTSGERKTESEAQRDYGASTDELSQRTGMEALAPLRPNTAHPFAHRDHGAPTDGFSQKTGMEAPLRPNTAPRSAYRDHADGFSQKTGMEAPLRPNTAPRSAYRDYGAPADRFSQKTGMEAPLQPNTAPRSAYRDYGAPTDGFSQKTGMGAPLRPHTAPHRDRGASFSQRTVMEAPLRPNTAPRPAHRDHGASTDGFSQKTGMEAPLRPNTAPSSARRWSLKQMTGLRRNRQVSNASANNPRYIAIQKMLLLNAYPLAYIVLWIPGLANRLLEATGRSSGGLQIAQASWQLVGLANAVTYGWNEGVAAQFRKKFSERRRGSY